MLFHYNKINFVKGFILNEKQSNESKELMMVESIARAVGGD